jgi:hypothetical protein
MESVCSELESSTVTEVSTMDCSDHLMQKTQDGTQSNVNDPENSMNMVVGPCMDTSRSRIWRDVTILKLRVDGYHLWLDHHTECTE